MKKFLLSPTLIFNVCAQAQTKRYGAVRKMNKLVRALIFALLLTAPAAVFSQTAEELFEQVPEDAVTVEREKRRNLIAESKGDFLKLQLNEETTGEFKVVSQKKDEFLVGVVWKDCEHSKLAFWQVKKGVWKDVTDKVIEPIGKKDVIAVLRASPLEIEDPGREISVSFFYTFENDSGRLQLIARKQDSCEISGTVYRYTFNGRKFIKNKR
jgi:hypothetical protein